MRISIMLPSGGLEDAKAKTNGKRNYGSPEYQIMSE